MRKVRGRELCASARSLPQNLRMKLRVNGWPKSYDPEDVKANHLIELRILHTALKANAI